MIKSKVMRTVNGENIQLSHVFFKGKHMI